MKCTFFFLVAAITAIALAAPGKLTRCDIELPPGAYWEDNYVVIRNPPPPSGATGTLEDLAEPYGAEEPDESAIFANIAASFDNRTAPFANSTSPAVGDGTDGKKYIADIRMQVGEMQHVGTLRKQRLWDVLYDCFRSLCAISDGFITCLEEKPFDGLSCKVKNIVYSDGFSYSTNAHLTITYRAVHHSPDKTNLDLATYDMVAGIYKTMSEIDENCYVKDFSGSRATTMCNVPTQVMVAFPVEGDSSNNATSFIASVWFNGKTDEGGMNCEASRDKVASFFNDKIKTKMANAYGVSANDVVPRVNCVEKWCFLPNYWWDCNRFLPNQG
ncbi:uncharacterized protein K460DRAFT_394126 [Cucurbitaria berberidis CBS 394.84]|uniref:Uncharacterized protein n=1 Tax=Cucurbitaria berberidis CBS 394.84 TaxID=1168544 RepID=A0A9P4LB73_9PLEO|nr:uncharacterized protein K460DRAFT_394126 [Cucurbitaria berberidis CBS 394.84]KAF1849261.1 hypothetical protein K460DRAFT_394126 [Cucurbitaria berberidis CBS 394.84]